MTTIMPNFLILGAAKAGTTSLHYYLDQHPEIYMSKVKEPRFFALEGETPNFQNPDNLINRTSITELEEYQQLFADVSTEKAIGETSPLYLYSAKAVERIKYYIPQAKLIVVLRNPVERAYSCYTHLVREGYESLSFEAGLATESERIANNWAHLWHYRQAGYYYQQVKRYFDCFAPEQIQVYLYEDLNQDSVALVQNVCRFLEVADDFVPDLTRQNVSGIPKYKALHHLVNRGNSIRKALKRVLPQQLRSTVAQNIREWNLQAKPPLTATVAHKLKQQYREDILKLQDLLQRDLVCWLSES